MKHLKVIITANIIMLILVTVVWAGNKEVTVSEYGAVGDGVANDTNALKAAFKAARGRLVVLQKNATYFITGQLDVPDGAIVKGNNALIIYTPVANENALSIRSSNVTISDLIIRPKGVSKAPNGAMRMPLVIGEYGNTFGNKPYTNIVLDNITIQGGYVGMNGIAIFGDVSDIRISNVRIIGSKTYGYADIGILVHWSANNTNKPNTTYHPHKIKIDNSFFENVATSATYEQPSCIFLSGSYDVDITNTTGNNINTGIYVYPGDYGFSYARTIDSNQVRNINIVNSNFKDVRKYGFRVLGQVSGKGQNLYMGVNIVDAQVSGTNSSSFAAVKVDKVSGGVSIKNVK